MVKSSLRIGVTIKIHGSLTRQTPPKVISVGIITSPIPLSAPVKISTKIKIA